MAKEEQLQRLRDSIAENNGCAAWNLWRRAEKFQTRIDLSGTNLTGSHLNDIDLSGANLSDADLSSTDLSRANLSYSNFSGNNFSHSNLKGANLSGANLSGANFSGAFLIKACLSEATLNRTTFSRATLNEADLRMADLNEAKLNGADLNRAILNMASLRKADLRGARLREASLRKANLCDTNLRGANCCNADFSEVDFSRADLREADFNEAILCAATFNEAYFYDIGLQGADLRGAMLRGARLRGFTFGGNYFKQADFTGATLTGADFGDVNLDGVRLTKEQLASVRGIPLEAIRRKNMQGLFRAVLVRMIDPPWKRIPGDEHDHFSHIIVWLFGWGWSVAGLLAGALLGTYALAAWGNIFQLNQDVTIIGGAVIGGILVQLLGSFLLLGYFALNRRTGRRAVIGFFGLALLPLLAVSGFIGWFLTRLGAAYGLTGRGFLGGLLIKLIAVIAWPLIKGAISGEIMRRFLLWLRHRDDPSQVQ
jgi:uncharacterized protein YjbI with pentapeptide repeats